MPLEMFEDNKGCIALATNNVMTTGKTKHIDVKYHFLRDLFESGKLELFGVSRRRCLPTSSPSSLFRLGSTLPSLLSCPGDIYTWKLSSHGPGNRRTPTVATSG